jgi:hypothetical protein
MNDPQAWKMPFQERQNEHALGFLPAPALVSRKQVTGNDGFKATHTLIGLLRHTGLKPADFEIGATRLPEKTVSQRGMVIEQGNAVFNDADKIPIVALRIAPEAHENARRLEQIAEYPRTGAGGTEYDNRIVAIHPGTHNY